MNAFALEDRLFQVEYAIEVINLGSTAVDIEVADGYVVLQHAFHSLFIMLLIAAVAIWQPHATYTVLFISLFASYGVVIAVKETLNSMLLLPRSVEKIMQIVHENFHIHTYQNSAISSRRNIRVHRLFAQLIPRSTF